jgi:methylenetetrahydrofolate--tRNA-(uracil-5-)-methyltransferase
MGLLAGINGARLASGRAPVVPPPETALGSLVHHLTGSDPLKFQPSNINFGLFPPWQEKVKKKVRGQERALLALASLALWQEREGV